LTNNSQIGNLKSPFKQKQPSFYCLTDYYLTDLKGRMNTANDKMGRQSARWAVASVGLLLTPKWKAIQFAVVNLVHSRRVRRRNRSANGCPPTKGCPPLLLTPNVIDSKTLGNTKLPSFI
jgi:hypothetical protein